MTRPSASPRGWLQGEPEIEEMLHDPIVQLVMQRDGLTPQQLRRALRAGGERLMAAPTTVGCGDGEVRLPDGGGRF